MEEKPRKSKIFKFFIVVLIGIILFFSKKENQDKFIDFLNTSKTINKDLKVVKSIPIESDIEDIAFYGEDIMLWKDKKLIRLKLDGSKEWAKEFNFDDPIIRFGEKNIYVYEKTMGDIYILNSMGETLNRIQLETNINNVVESFENVLVHIKNPDVEGVSILNKNGEIIGNTTIKDKNILTYSINTDNTIYAISSLNLNEGNLKSEIQVFKSDGELLFTTQFNDKIILYSSFIGKDKLVVMLDKGLYFFDNDNVLWEKEIQLVKDIYIDRERINILYGNTLETLSSDGKVEEKYLFTEEYNKIVPYGKYLILYGDEYIIGLRDGEEVFKYKSEGIILKVIQGNQNFIVIYEDKIDILTF